MYTLQSVPGKGKGLVASESIPKGIEILSETPVITTPERQRDAEWLKAHILRQVDFLNEHQRQSFLSMHNLYSYRNIVEQSFLVFMPSVLFTSRAEPEK